MKIAITLIALLGLATAGRPDPKYRHREDPVGNTDVCVWPGKYVSDDWPYNVKHPPTFDLRKEAIAEYDKAIHTACETLEGWAPAQKFRSACVPVLGGKQNLHFKVTNRHRIVKIYVDGSPENCIAHFRRAMDKCHVCGGTYYMDTDYLMWEIVPTGNDGNDSDRRYSPFCDPNEGQDPDGEYV